MKETYKGIDLMVCADFKEYEQYTGNKMCFTDAAGSDVEVNLNELEIVGESKEHFASDDTLKPDPLHWFANEYDGIREIVLILVGNVKVVDYKTLLSFVGHEYGHLVNGDDFKNSKQPYETEQGYIEEETKGIAFQKYMEDVYEMTELFRKMLNCIGIAIDIR